MRRSSARSDSTRPDRPGAAAPAAGPLLERLAPEGPAPARLLYLLVRAAHFLVMTLAIPLAYRAALALGGGPTLPEVLMIVAWFSLLLWMMFFFLLHGHAYPVRLGEAIAVTTIPVVNLCAAGVEGFGRGALTVVLGSNVALALGLLIMRVIVTVPSLRDRHVPGVPGYMGKLLAGLLPFQLLVVALFGLPLARPAAFRAHPWLLLGLVAQVLSELRLLRRSSVLDPEGSRLDTPRARAAAAWAPFMILCMFAALVGFVWAAFLRH